MGKGATDERGATETETEEGGRVAQRGFGKMPENGKGGFVVARILFRLEIRKYLELFYIAPAVAAVELERRGREGGSFKSKIEWKAPRKEKPLLALHLCEMRNIYARMLLKGGTAEKERGGRGSERERERKEPHTLTYSVALAECMKGMFTPPAPAPPSPSYNSRDKKYSGSFSRPSVAVAVAVGAATSSSR